MEELILKEKTMTISDLSRLMCPLLIHGESGPQVLEHIKSLMLSTYDTDDEAYMTLVKRFEEMGHLTPEIMDFF